LLEVTVASLLGDGHWQALSRCMSVTHYEAARRYSKVRLDQGNTGIPWAVPLSYSQHFVTHTPPLINHSFMVIKRFGLIWA